MYARMHVNVEPISITIGEVIHVLNIMKCMDSDIMYIINVYNNIWNDTDICLMASSHAAIFQIVLYGI